MGEGRSLGTVRQERVQSQDLEAAVGSSRGSVARELVACEEGAASVTPRAELLDEIVLRVRRVKQLFQLQVDLLCGVE